MRPTCAARRAPAVGRRRAALERPRNSPSPSFDGATVEAGRLEPIRPARSRPTASLAIDLAPDQLAAVDHHGGPVRVIAPAGSGKTRVLTERMRHLLADRGYEREAVIAVAYNKLAQNELETRLDGARPADADAELARLLGSLSRHRGGTGRRVLDRAGRRGVIAEEVFPIPRQRRTNTDPIGPYLEALTLVRLGLARPGRGRA